MFYVWSPTAQPDGAIQLVLTSREAEGVSDKTAPFAQKIVAAIGLTAKVVRAECTACRSNYFTDYPDEDWQSVWQPAWQWHIQLAAPAKRVPKLKEAAWIACDELYDDHFSHPKHGWATDFSRKVHGLVVGDFKTDSKLHAARAAIATSRTVAKLAAKAPSFRVAATVGSFRQLQVNLGLMSGRTFQSPELANSVCELLKKAGGHVHHVH